jgi:hypothetical protein
MRFRRHHDAAVQLEADLIRARRIVGVWNIEDELVLDAVSGTVAQPHLSSRLGCVGPAASQAAVRIIETDAAFEDGVDLLLRFRGILRRPEARKRRIQRGRLSV